MIHPNVNNIYYVGSKPYLSREITDNVGKVTTPESGKTLLLVDTGEAVANASVARDLTRHNARVGILSLDNLYKEEGKRMHVLHRQFCETFRQMSNHRETKREREKTRRTNLTRSMGAVQVLAIAPETPPSKKSVTNPRADASFAMAAVSE